MEMGDGEIGRGKGVRMGGARPVRLACRGLTPFKHISESANPANAQMRK